MKKIVQNKIVELKIRILKLEIRMYTLVAAFGLLMLVLFVLWLVSVVFDV